jgi:CRP-like cAMP-binding protein
MDALAMSPRQNRLLASLPPDTQALLQPGLESVSLTKGKSLWDVGDVVRHTYFPTEGLVSLVASTAEGNAVELATVACEGVVGLPILLHARVASHQALVRLEGAALRLSAATLRVEMQRHEALRSALLAYAHRVSGEMAQAVVCQCYHNVLQRLCRWLLAASDSTGTDALELTHESLAAALGVLRSVLTEAALELQDADAIRCRHGRIVIRNRGLLLRSACECYEATRTTRAGEETAQRRLPSTRATTTMDSQHTLASDATPAADHAEE